jgi:hypothetical protein
MGVGALLHDGSRDGATSRPTRWGTDLEPFKRLRHFDAYAASCAPTPPLRRLRLSAAIPTPLLRLLRRRRHRRLRPSAASASASILTAAARRGGRRRYSRPPRCRPVRSWGARQPPDDAQEAGSSSRTSTAPRCCLARPPARPVSSGGYAVDSRRRGAHRQPLCRSAMAEVAKVARLTSATPCPATRRSAYSRGTARIAPASGTGVGDHLRQPLPPLAPYTIMDPDCKSPMDRLPKKWLDGRFGVVCTGVPDSRRSRSGDCRESLALWRGPRLRGSCQTNLAPARTQPYQRRTSPARFNAARRPPDGRRPHSARTLPTCGDLTD